MLSNLSKLADRNFVLGFLLPTLLAAVFLLAEYRDEAPFKDLWIAVLQDESWKAITVFVLAIWVGAVLLALLNTEIYRMFEGYWGPLRWKWLVKRKKAAFNREVDWLERASVASPRPSGYIARLSRLYERFPLREDLVLPTRFGNAIRAFETYPLKLYGLDAIPVWLRLQGVVPKAFSTLIDSARAEVDFFVNATFLAAVFALVSIVRAIFEVWSTHPDMDYFFATHTNVWVALAASLPVALLSYRQATARAIAWGGLVKSAFDLYLPALAAKLGYALPPTEESRRDFWEALSESFLFLEPMNPEKWPRPHESAEGTRSSQEAEASNDDEADLDDSG